ncbi:hypothetical protein [Micropruina sp.]|uniref:hypothetical protein n=1 Tax=Micropruina sp. TaxID=2737536 RepID=UPI0039E63B61
MTGFSFATAQRIVFGAGRSAGLASLVAEFGARPFVCTGADPARFGGLLAGLPQGRTWPVAGEPELDEIRPPS